MPTYGSRCGSVDRVVTSYARDLQFESNHWQNVFTVVCIEVRIKKKSPGMAH